MTRRHGIAADTYEKLLLDSGAIYKDFVSVGTPGTLLGATRGGAVFKRMPTYKETPYEGIPGQVVGQKHLTGVKVSLEVNTISFDEDNLALAIPNSSVSAPSGGYVQISETEWDAEAVHSLTNIAILAQLSGTALVVAIVLDNPICEKDLNLGFKDKNEAVSKWLFSAFYDESTGFATPPWRMYWPV
jgi:hypothetical protein